MPAHHPPRKGPDGNIDWYHPDNHSPQEIWERERNDKLVKALGEIVAALDVLAAGMRGEL